MHTLTSIPRHRASASRFYSNPTRASRCGRKAAGSSECAVAAASAARSPAPHAATLPRALSPRGQKARAGASPFCVPIFSEGVRHGF
jgi:hypothetical protein